MNRRQFIEVMILEWFLLGIMSVCVTVSLAEGFCIPEKWSGRILPAFLFCACVCLYWILISFNKKTSIFGIVIFITMLTAIVFILMQSSEKLEKIILYLLISLLVSTSVFFLSRTRIGTALLIAAGCIVICGNAFLQYGSHPKLLFLYMPVSVILFIERNYRIRIRKSSTRAPSIMRQTTAGLICCVLAITVAGMSMLLIIPAQLPTHELKLIKELVRMPILEKIGTASTIPLDDKDQYTDEKNNEKNSTSMEGDQRTEKKLSEENQDADITTEKNEQETVSGGKVQKRRAVRYDVRLYLQILTPLFVIAIIISAILLKRKQRRIRQERFDRLNAQESVAAYYQYFLHMLSLIRLEDNKSDTVREYLRKARWRTEALFPGKSEFARISHDFERICYGEEPFDDDTRTRFREAYRMLPSLCCKNAGRIRYLLLFFRT